MKNKIVYIKYFILLLLIVNVQNCASQKKKDIQFLYQSKYYENSEVVGYSIYDSKNGQYTIYENLPSSKIDKKVKILLSKNELDNLYKLYKSLRLPENKICIYNNDGKLSGEITFTFNSKKNDTLKCFNEEDKEKPLLVISQFLKFLKSKQEYKDTFPEEFLIE